MNWPGSHAAGDDAGVVSVSVQLFVVTPKTVEGRARALNGDGPLSEAVGELLDRKESAAEYRAADNPAGQRGPGGVDGLASRLSLQGGADQG